VRLDREGPKTGEQKRVAFRLADYAHLDHGYAATVHKSQSVTVDRTHVVATPGMDRHLAYVAMSRHRQSVTLQWSKESFVSVEGLVARLSRERAKDTTLDYGESDEEGAIPAWAGEPPGKANETTQTWGDSRVGGGTICPGASSGFFVGPSPRKRHRPGWLRHPP
jgi:hypothetical protein